VNFISVKGPALLSKYVGESERQLRDVFRKARQAAPCIIFFDEIDALIPARTEGSSDSPVTDRVLSQFLAEMDGIEELNNVLVLGATNRPDRLDPAVLRPGRFDDIIEIPAPDAAGRREIFEIHLRDKPLSQPFSIEDMADRTAGRTGADIASICNLAALKAVRRAVAASKSLSADLAQEAAAPNTQMDGTNQEEPAPHVKVVVTREDLEAALSEVAQRQ